ncbi:MAG: hypothetical protein HWD57_12360 [Candidatus Accumulibacter cognatus]|uniref:Uncharacterized protein n=1 Tax=Candidatus Accumulibacter cognatus TaxID=2954383 RepID=A0A7D5SF52_9PROT|nr:MAG: hypothetical protein HWD57_12360 [Candidatus Accumulibacter cognatus]HRE18379.1 hypothetical protein [Rhodocyclaceae bacterium]
MNRAPSGWLIANQLAQNVPNCSGSAKHKVISALLALLLDLLKTTSS